MYRKELMNRQPVIRSIRDEQLTSFLFGSHGQPVIRSIRDTEKMFKEMDPNTEITEHTLRKMVAEGTIPAFKTGNKYLLNVTTIIEMFNTPVNGMSKISGAPGGLQAIEKNV